MAKRSKKANLGLVIRDLRENRKLTPAEFAKKANISVSHLSNLESGRRDLPIKLAPSFAKVLKVNETELIKLAINQAVSRSGIKTSVSITVK